MLELYIYSAIKGFSSQWVWSAPSLDSSENCHSFIYSAVLKLWFSEGQSTYFLYSFISLSLYFTFMKSDIFLKECECGMHFHCMISLQCFHSLYFVIVISFVIFFQLIYGPKPTMDLSSIVIATSTFIFYTFLHDNVLMDQRCWWDRIWRDWARELTRWKGPFPSRIIHVMICLSFFF